MSGTSSTASTAGTRDIQFVHAYIVYQLLSRRIQRDLLLVSSLISSSKASTPRRTGDKTPSKSKAPIPSSSKAPKEQVDVRLYPALVKLLDTVLQSLNQMRTLSIVDESPDLATAVDARIAFTNARRCAQIYMCFIFHNQVIMLAVQMSVPISLLPASQEIRRSPRSHPTRHSPPPRSPINPLHPRPLVILFRIS